MELKYAYLEEDDQCLVVISSLLNASQEDSLLDPQEEQTGHWVENL